MRRIPLIAAFLFVAACSQQERESPPDNETAAETSKPPAADAAPSLEGEWQVAAIDGKPVSGASAMTAEFAGGKAIVASGCLRRAWSYTQHRNIVAFSPDPGGSANCGGGTSGEQETAYAALESASIAIFGKDGSEASLSGTGGNLTLQRR